MSTSASASKQSAKAASASALGPDWVVVNGQPVRIVVDSCVTGSVKQGASGLPLTSPATASSDDKGALDTKEGIGAPTMAPTFARLKHVMMSKGGKGGKSKTSDPVKVRLAAQYVTTSAAVTALSAVQALSPIGVADYSSFAALFDLWRVRGVTVHFRLTGSATPAGSGAWALAFDPSNVGAYSGVDDVLTAQHHAGPCAFGIKATMFPEAYDAKGYYCLKLSLPAESRVTNDGAAANAVGGGWVGTSNTTAIIGWLKPFVASFGPGITSTMDYFVVYDVEFKART